MHVCCVSVSACVCVCVYVLCVCMCCVYVYVCMAVYVGKYEVIGLIEVLLCLKYHYM